jgi:hypothetical protein
LNDFGEHSATGGRPVAGRLQVKDDFRKKSNYSQKKPYGFLKVA